VVQKMADYPMSRVDCGARTRQGGACRQPAMRNGRCRLHGGKSKSGKEHGRYKHGYFTREAMTDRRECAALLRKVRTFLKDFPRTAKRAFRWREYCHKERQKGHQLSGFDASPRTRRIVHCNSTVTEHYGSSLAPWPFKSFIIGPRSV